MPPVSVTLRDVVESDLPVFFENQLDPEANRMAAFTSDDPFDRASFIAHWAKILASPTVAAKTILYGTEVAGSVLCFEMFGEVNVSYWIGRAYWGRGIATEALRQLLAIVATRPLYGRAAKDNIGSIRVLQKCGFALIGEERGYAKGRGAEIDEVILRLDT